MSTWENADQESAMSMGWLIADVEGSGVLEIQRHDANPAGFESDAEARGWVTLAAAMGNDLEQRALAHVAAHQQPSAWCVEHPRFPVSDWKYAVANDDTRFGYTDWVLARAAEEQKS